MMSLTWYLLGVVSALFGSFLYEYNKKNGIDKISLTGIISGVVLILFSIAWGVGAVLEGVPRAGSMGLLLFGLSGVVILTVSIRYHGSQKSKANTEGD